jgi:AbrB family looped-hinge helix DNA binding protein
MTAHGKLTADGRLSVPKELLDRRGWKPGTEFDVTETPDGLSLTAKSDLAPRNRMSWEEFDRRRPRYDGPPVTLEEMDEAILRETARRWREKEVHSR